MISHLRLARRRIAALTGRLKSDTRGQIAIMFAVSSIAIILAAGAGIDLARAYSAQLKLSEVATLACQYANRPSVYNTATGSYTTNGTGYQTYQTAVNNFIQTSLAAQKWNLGTPTGSQFTATPAGPSNPTAGPTNGNVQLIASVPTTFMQLAQVSQMPVSAAMPCYSTTNNVPPTANGNNPFVLRESFENNPPGGGISYFEPDGTTNQPRNNPTSTIGASPTYQGLTNQWYVIGYCLETDRIGIINSTVPDGSRAAELDCENGFYSGGNSSISTEIFLPAGSYELRWNYRSRVDYPNYDPAYICGTAPSDVSWATSSNAATPFTGNVKTNQINVYLDLNTAGAPPTHKTLDGTLTLGGANQIDSCVYSPTWIERSVRISVTTPGYYWLSFAADGANDSFGGQIDNLRLCNNTCPGSLQDNYPIAWTTSPNLFEDTFEAPVYTQDLFPAHYIAKGGNPYLSLGTSGTSSSGWPTLAASGWAAAPYNQFTYTLKGAYQGSQYIALDGWNGAYPATNRNRVISRPFLLDPGYYKVNYGYLSMVTFPSTISSGTYCKNAPSSGPLYSGGITATGQIVNYTTITTNTDTNLLGVFMSHAQLASTPNLNAVQGAPANYTNPDGSVTTAPTVAPDNVSLSNYDAAQVNPLLDFCSYSDSWAPRTAYIKITKPAYYWLTFSSQMGTSDGNGPGIDDVKLTALGSAYTFSPPSNTVAIPGPAPVSDSSYTNGGAFTGFKIAADPFSPPAAAP